MTGLLLAHQARHYSLSIIIIGDGAAAKALADAAHAHAIFHRHIMQMPTGANLPQGHPAHGKQALDGKGHRLYLPRAKLFAANH